MSSNLKEISQYVLSLNRYLKRSIALITDGVLCVVCTWIAFVLRLEEIILIEDFDYHAALLSLILALPIFWLFGLYRAIFRYTSLSIILNILTSVLVYGLLFFLLIGVYGITSSTNYYEIVPRSIGIIQPMLLFFALISSRLGVKYLLTYNYNFTKSSNKKNILVYGAGDAGRQLVLALENSPEFEVLGFLDDNNQLHRQVLLGKTVYSPTNLAKLLKSKNILLVFLALPSISRRKRNQIIQNLNKYKIIVKTLPSISEIVDGRINVSDIKDFNINDLLNRDEVKPDKKLLSKNIDSKTVLVTGAGGSIGSELCRQIIRLKPSKLLLLESNEFALYKIYEELIVLNKNLKIISLLANAQNQEKLEVIFDTFKVNTVYHAAAYKHVPLVEENICEGIKNNVFSTFAVAKASINKKVTNLVLISSDKAVRPTNIMGATKRISELCLQGLHKENKNTITNFSIVRFGNVLESSGSVIPKFKKQIKEGGPVTLTHKDVTRYFMTITEAAQLVIQASALGKNSEVFVLDMGKSIRIKELIEKMINFSGFSIKNTENPGGDVEIKIIGLRPGEKLYEELLIGNDPEKTRHPKILMAKDSFVPLSDLENNLNDLKLLLEDNKIKEVKNLIEKLIKSYNPNSKVVDHLYVEKSLLENFEKGLSLNDKEPNKIIKLIK
tara:strand:- start:1553 stop:3559 length:2007 start_codon:yes stop_codon:yes gene_type:complete